MLNMIFFDRHIQSDSICEPTSMCFNPISVYSTVTDFARLRGISTFLPLLIAM